MRKFKIGDLFKYTQPYGLHIGDKTYCILHYPKINSIGIVLSRRIKKEYVMVYINGQLGKLFIDAIEKI